MAPESGRPRLLDRERVRGLVVDANDGIMAVAGIAEGFLCFYGQSLGSYHRILIKPIPSAGTPAAPEVSVVRNLESAPGDGKGYTRVFCRIDRVF